MQMSEVDSLCEWLLALSCRPTKASTVYCLYNLATGEALHTKHNYKYTNAFTYIQIHKYKYTKASTVHAALPLVEFCIIKRKCNQCEYRHALTQVL